MWLAELCRRDRRRSQESSRSGRREGRDPVCKLWSSSRARLRWGRIYKEKHETLCQFDLAQICPGKIIKQSRKGEEEEIFLFLSALEFRPFSFLPLSLPHFFSFQSG